MVPILYWVKRQRARHELGVAKGSVVWDRPGGERGAGPETDVTTISRITRPHVSGRDFQRDRLAQAAACSSDSRAGRRPPEKRRGESIGQPDRDQLATGRSGSYRNAPVRVTETALQAGTWSGARPGGGRSPSSPAAGARRRPAAATALLRFPFCLRQRHPS